MTALPDRLESLDVESILRTDRWLRRLSGCLAGCASQADDCRQDTWLAALRKAPAAPDGGGPPKAWLRRVAANFLRQAGREASRRRRRECLVSRPESSAGTLPQEAVERAELRQEVLRAVLALDEPYRTAVVLRFLEELSVKEVAAVQGIPVSTAKTRISRSLDLLRASLDGIYGGRRAWLALLAPFLSFTGAFSGSFFGSASGAASSAAAATLPARAAPGWAILKQGVLASMSAKMIVSAACASVLFLAGAGVAIRSLQRESPSRAPGSSAVDPAAAAARRSTELAGKDPAASQAPAASPAAGPTAPHPVEAVPPGVDPTTAADLDAAAAAAAAAVAAEKARGAETEAALALRRELDRLKKTFGEGGREGWTSIGKGMAALHAMLQSDEGVEAFLALLDEEPDAEFLEALLHHLPLARTELQEEILKDGALHDEIWSRSEREKDPERRAAFLRFFAYNRKLSASRMGDFVRLAEKDPAPAVRQLCIDAISSNGELIESTWETLAAIAENDSSPRCREDAIAGLALAKSPRAAAIVKAAFTSPDESMRMAAVLSAAGENPPADITGGDPVAFLLQELRAASTRQYKKALSNRLLERSPDALEQEIQRALPAEKDWGVRKDYGEMMERIRGGR